MTDSFNNNVTALSVETPVTFLNACLFVLAILSTISLSDAEPGKGPGGPPLLIFRPKWGPKGRKNFLGDRSPPPPNLRVWMTAPPLSQGLDDRPPPLSQGLDDRPPPLSEGLDPPLVKEKHAS